MSDAKGVARQTKDEARQAKDAPLAMPKMRRGKKIAEHAVKELGGLLDDAIWFYAR